MALVRRSGQRFATSIWTGFVDAMTALLLVLIFVLTVFMIVQYLLNTRISELGSELFDLSGELQDRDERLEQRDLLVQTLQTQLSELEALLDEEQNMTAFLDSALGLARSESNSLRSTVQDLEAAIGRLELRAAALASQLASALSDIELKEGELSQAAAEFAERERSLKDTLAERNALLEDLRSQLQAISSQLADERSQAEDMSAALANSQMREAEANAQLETYSARLSDLAATLKSTTGILDAERLESARAQESLARALADLAARSDELQLALAGLAEKDVELGELRSRLAAALDAVAAAERLAAEEKTQSLAREGTLEATIRDLQNRLGARETQLAQAEASELDAVRNSEELARRVAQLQGMLDSSRQTSEEELALVQLELESTSKSLAAALIDLEASSADAERILLMLAVSQQAEEELESRIGKLEASIAERDQIAQTAASLEERLRAALADLAREQENRRQDTIDFDTALAEARRLADQRQSENEESLRQVELLTRQILELQIEIATLQSTIDESVRRDTEEGVQVSLLGEQLNQALARAAAMARRNEELERRERERLEEEAGRLKRYQSEFMSSLRDLMEGYEGVQIVGDRFLFSSEVLFASSEVTLTAAGKEQIRNVAELMLEVAEEIPADVDWVLRIDGHTDDVPVVTLEKYEDNWELSAGRSLSVVHYLIDEIGFPPQRLVAAGFGEFRPVDNTGDVGGRAKNRRIEIKLVEP